MILIYREAVESEGDEGKVIFSEVIKALTLSEIIAHHTVNWSMYYVKILFEVHGSWLLTNNDVLFDDSTRWMKMSFITEEHRSSFWNDVQQSTNKAVLIIMQKQFLYHHHIVRMEYQI